MATEKNFDFGEFLNEFIADDASGDEFEGFSLDDVVDNPTENFENYIDADNWTNGDREPPQLNFTKVAGMRQTIRNKTSPMEYFKLFLSDPDYEFMAQQTNLYAQQYISSAQLKPNSRYHKWHDTNKSEIKQFIALVVAMGLVRQLDVKEYWTTDPVTSTPFFPSVMPRDRFLSLMAFFHLNDNLYCVPRGEEGYDPLYKLGPLYQKILYRFDTVYQPHQNLCIDEGMVPWRGNLHFRVYSPDKPDKYGLKAYILCDAENGYCLKMKLYTGKPTTPPSEKGATYDLVMNLLRNHFACGHVLYCDNYYASPTLFMDLWCLGVGATGTVRPNRRGIPEAIKEVQLESRGDVSVVSNGPLTVTKYLDAKPVYLISTVSQSTPVATGKHNHRDEELVKPLVVHKYNSMMGAVDRLDMVVSAAKLEIKTMKWWKKVIFHLITLAIANAYTLYKENSPEECILTHRHFRKKLVHELLDSSGFHTKVTGRPGGRSIERLTGRHFLGRICRDRQKALSRSCIVCCKANSKPELGRKRPGRQTSYQCTQCQVAL